MNKLFKTAASFFVGAAVFISQTQAASIIGAGNSQTAFAAPTGPSDNSVTGKPEVLGYTVTDSRGKEISSIRENRKFNLTIDVMDRLLKAGDITSADNIVFTKSLGRFKFANSSVRITSSGAKPLEYTITITDCVWQGGSSSFGFLVGYDSGVDFYDLSLDISECSEPNNTPSDPSSSSAEPIFKITADNTTEIKAGDSGRFEINLKNLGSIDAERVLIEITSSDDIILTDGSYTQDINRIGAYDTETIEVNYKALGKINSAKQPFNISMRYYYDNGNGETTGNTSTTINIPAVISGSSSAAEPIFKITPSTVSEIKCGESGYFTLNIKNLGSVEAKRILVETTASDDVVLDEQSLSQEILLIPANTTSSLSIRYTALDKINSAKQSFSVSIRYFYDGAGGETSAETTASVSIPSVIYDMSSANSDPLLKLIGPSPTVPISAKSEYEYTLTIRNFGDTVVSNANIFFEATDSLYFVDGTDMAFIEEIPANGSTEVKVKFRTSDSISSIKQGITAHITYSYVTGGIKKNADTDTSVIIIAEGSGGSGGNAAVPNIIIKSYDIGAEQIAAGDPFDLKLEMLNTSSVTGIENVIMTINAGGAINIFGGTNTFYYSKLNAGGEISETIPLKALATAETGTSSISVSLKYDYFDNGTRATSSIEQTIFIPVYQPDKMTFEVSVPTYSVQVGNDTYITTTYLNKGRSEISNVKAEIVGDVSALSTSKVIGTVQPGGNGSFDFIVSPYMSGMCEFTIKITYEDATMTEVTKELPVSFAVDEPFDPGFIDPGFEDPGFEDPTDEGGKFPWVVLWIGIGVLVVGGIVTIIIVVNRKKKKKAALTEADIDWEDEFDDVPNGNTSNKNNDNNTTKV